MATAADLEEAAGQSFDNLFAKWVGGTLKTRLTTFYQTVLPTFPESDPSGHPVANWLVLIASITDKMDAGNSFVEVPYDVMVTVSGYVYRLCWIANQLNIQSSITGAQAAAVLTAYNAAF